MPLTNGQQELYSPWVTTPTTQPTYPGCRIAISQAFLSRNVPSTSIDVMIASLAPNTLKQYNAGLRLWWDFVALQGTSPFQATTPLIIQFLTERLQAGASHGTLNSFRSALSLLIGPWVGTDDLIRRLFKGIFRLKPSKPKYNLTWDPEIILNCLAKWSPNSDLPLQRLSMKLATLLALVTAHRVQTLALIDIRNISTSNDGIEIKIPDLMKTSGPGRFQPVLYLPFFRERPEICPAAAISVYLQRTLQWRTSYSKLFLTFAKPHHPATPQTLSRWIKNTLCASGLDVTIFSAHSTRHAATSSANKRGVSLECIRKTAGWGEKSTVFAKFYNRHISTKDMFAKAVCNLLPL